ncbi:hypothetical protein CLV50_2914 [Flavobacterium lindanitolerans]|uniref:Uncharacterized protein n=1 Tax=Flavobacterium lindanitolerans TaxID=428988 RepID=A0A497TWR4_9FLAO|nr:hypothetical protein B0G92_3114 [Flavobacterium lindanitolerans]RLJ23641.1 hypothetical protein CLV50_2914 [Flavobacterium lindanitolerans]
MHTTTIQKVDCLFQAKNSSVTLTFRKEKLSHIARTFFYGILLLILHLPIRINKFDNSTINLNL